MKRIATLIVAAAFVLAPLAPAAASPIEHTTRPAAHRTIAAPDLPIRRGFPLCISTKWAEHHYDAPMTAPGTVCFVRMHVDPMGPVVKQSDPSVSLAPSWFPKSWTTLGWITNRDGDPIGQIVQAS